MANSLRLAEALSKDELRTLRQKSDLRAGASLLWTWALIAGAFALFIAWPNPLTFLAGAVILGGRQLALGVINHDCAHHAFFKNPKVDDFVGHWICGSPMNISLPAYRAYHLKHHKYAGTPDDPDIGFVKNYPVPAESLRRKFIRDLTGQTGYRDTLRKIRTFRFARQWQWPAFHIALLGILTAVGAPWAYLMWWVAEIFFYPAIVRLRQIGEHGTAKDRTRLAAPQCPRVYERMSRWMTVGEWRALGVVAQRGLPDETMVSLFQPDGPGTPAWLLTGNYRVILEYNCSSYYAMSVGLLADEIVN